MFCSDSPFFTRIAAGWLVNRVCCSYGVHVYDRHLRRMVLRRIPNFPTPCFYACPYGCLCAEQGKTLLADLRGFRGLTTSTSAVSSIFNLGKVLHLRRIVKFLRMPSKGLNIMMTTAERGFCSTKSKTIAWCACSTVRTCWSYSSKESRG